MKVENAGLFSYGTFIPLEAVHRKAVVDSWRTAEGCGTNPGTAWRSKYYCCGRANQVKTLPPRSSTGRHKSVFCASIGYKRRQRRRSHRPAL